VQRPEREASPEPDIRVLPAWQPPRLAFG
jgi:hypothetical protein